MKLTKVRITNFQSIQDSTEFDIDDITCLVGKNEAGKTALLKALYRLNPINENEGNFDPTHDYPRHAVVNYKRDIAANRRKPAEVVQATYALEDDDIDAVKQIAGTEYSFNDNPPIMTFRKGYSNQLTADLNMITDKCKSDLAKIKSSIESHLVGSIPKFLYFDEYYQMTGQDNIEALQIRISNNTLKKSDHPLLGLIHLAGFEINQITNITRTEDLIANLNAASNSLTREMLSYWSQNRHLRMEFDIRSARPEDQEGMTSGTNILGRVKNTRYNVDTSLGARSRGFVWFFSFLAWYQKLLLENQNLILLLDEPGLSLHAKAQGDLLGYFEEELKSHHQLIYTTHSPFMVDPKHFNRVRIVQDLSIESDLNNLPDEQQGTKVTDEVLDATPDSLFPLQGALGYEISQTLFIGPNSLIVEGASDLLYIDTMSTLLQKKGKAGLSRDWIITPAGGIDKVPTFVALIGANTNLNLAVLIDFQKKDKEKIENLYKKKLLKKKQVLTYADFVSNNEADIEDMFTDEFYLKLVNGEFGTDLTVNDLLKGSPRIVRRLEDYFENNPLSNGVKFNHYRPALYFSKNFDSLEAEFTESDLDRFQNAFDILNQLLVE